MQNLRRGSTAVEFAIVLPVLMLLAIGCGDFLRVFHFRQVVCNATRCGAMLGAGKQFTAHTAQHWQDEVHQAVAKELMNLPDYQSELASISLSFTTDSDQVKRIRLEATYPFNTVIRWPGLPEQVLIRHHVHIRQFR